MASDSHGSASTAAVAGPFAEAFDAIVDNVEQVIQGKAEVIDLALLCLVAEGHLLIEDVPGVGKTSLAKALAASLDCTWGRIQFTPDLLPSDVVGVTRLEPGHRRPSSSGPAAIFANLVLGDEINRASPKTQSALLEAMEERQVTVDGTTYPLAAPFMVIATQNPIEHEGTYPLPESQLDRFLMRIALGYPARAAELEILDTHGGADAARRPRRRWPRPPTSRPWSPLARAVHVAPSLKGYIVDLADATRRHPASPSACRPAPRSACSGRPGPGPRPLGRDYVVPDDIKALAEPVLAHRLALTPEAQLQGIDAGRRPRRRPGRGAGAHRPDREPAASGVLTPTGAGAWPRRPAALVVGRPACSASSSCSSSAPAAVALVVGAVALRAPHAASRLDVARELHPPRVHAGAPSRVELRVAQPRRAGARPCSRCATRSTAAGAGPLPRSPPLAPGEAARAAYRLPDRAAGHPRPSARSRSSVTDPFGLADARRRRPPPVTELTVYPARRRRRAPAPHHRATTRTRAPTTPPRSAVERRGLLRPAAVRGRRRPAPGPLAVHRPPRRADGPPGRDAVAGPGHGPARRPARRAHAGDSLELAVSAAASIVSAVLAGGARSCGWSPTDGADSGFAAGHAHVEAILEHLASVAPRPAHRADRRARPRSGASGSGGALAVVTTSAGRRRPTSTRLARLRSRFGSSRWC